MVSTKRDRDDGLLEVLREISGGLQQIAAELRELRRGHLPAVLNQKVIDGGLFELRAELRRGDWRGPYSIEELAPYLCDRIPALAKLAEDLRRGKRGKQGEIKKALLELEGFRRPSNGERPVYARVMVHGTICDQCGIPRPLVKSKKKG